MGLEMVDLVIGTEAAFGISIPDEDMFHIVTVGQYHDYLVAALGASGSGKCSSSVVFYRLRRAFADRLGVKRDEFKPDTELDSLMPRRSRRRVWSDLAKASDLTFPRLARPNWVYIVQAASVIGSIVAAFRLHWLYAIGVVAFPIAIYHLAAPVATRIPWEMHAVRGAVTAMLPMNMSRLGKDEHCWTPDEVWAILVGIIVDRLKVDPKEVTREAAFIADLGAG